MLAILLTSTAGKGTHTKIRLLDLPSPLLKGLLYIPCAKEESNLRPLLYQSSALTV